MTKLNIEDLIFTQEEVEEEGIEYYTEKIKNNDDIDSAKVRYCSHTNKHYLVDGHHKTYTLFFNFNIKKIKCSIDSCKKSIGYKLDPKDPCVIKESLYVFRGTIHDLKKVNYDHLIEE